MTVQFNPDGKLFAVFGPPGTGKTYYLSEQARHAAEKYGPQRVLICSLTRTAAHEIKSRVEIPERNVGTLHSFCYRGLGCPDIAQAKEHISDWNERHENWRIKPVNGKSGEGEDDAEVLSPFEDVGGQWPGDDLLHEVGVCRHRRLPPDLWSIRARAFHAAWEAWKQERDVVDFTDMIDRAVTEVPVPPIDTAVLIVDEAQDLSSLELAVIRKWSLATLTTVLAGDADQWLYQWRGAYPEVFLPGGLPTAQTRVLAQSHRVPVAAHALAQSIIRGCANRIDVEYRPKAVDGSIEEIDDDFGNCAGLVARAAHHTADQSLGSFMLIASCGFHLDALISGLRAHGVPFHNPFRAASGRLNPFGKRNGVTMPERLLALTKPRRTRQLWTSDEFRSFASVLSSERVLARGAKKAIESKDFVAPNSREDLVRLFRVEDHAKEALAGNIAWFEANAMDSVKPRMTYAMQCARRFGIEVFNDRPKVIVGTIHSVKGGEADVVALSPDLSPSGMETLQDDEDSIRRLFYVGATRTKSDLLLCQPQRRRYEAGLW